MFVAQDYRQGEVKVFEEKRNQAKAKIEWKITSTDAREKLSRHYPSVSVMTKHYFEKTFAVEKTRWV